MSFPYRLISIFTNDQTVIIILLRLLNIALAAMSLVLFRRLLRRVGTGKVTTNIVMAVFVLIPVTPLLAGQINYDNLLLLCVAVFCLLIERIIASTKANKLPLGTILVTLAFGLLSSLVKYAFLPILAASGVFVLWYLWRHWKRDWSTFRRALSASWHGLTSLKQFGLIALLLLSIGLFSQRYVVNVVVYHSLIPDCGKVLDNEACQQYGPWNRDFSLSQNKSDNDESSPVVYMAEWLYGMWYRLFFVIKGGFAPDVYQNFPPLPVIGVGAISLFIFGIAAFIATFKRVMRDNHSYVYFLAICIVYVAILWLQNYGAFLRTGQPVAINGRYLLPILLLIGAILAKSVALLLRKVSVVRSALAVLVLLLFLEGGGLVGFIVRSNDAWYWQNDMVRSVNHAADNLLSPLVAGSQSSLPIPNP